MRLPPFCLHWCLLCVSVASSCMLSFIVASEEQLEAAGAVEEAPQVLDNETIPGAAEDKFSVSSDKWKELLEGSLISHNFGVSHELNEPTTVPFPLPGQADQELKNDSEAVLEVVGEATTTAPPAVAAAEEEAVAEEPLAAVESGSPNASLAQNETEHEDNIPSFSEWTQKQLEQLGNSSEGRGQGPAKKRSKNYASPDCGAKIVAANPEAVSPGAVLSPSKDEYKLNTCNSRIWFVAELCEAIQAEKVELANFELFSSTPKEFTVSVSDRFPTKEWTIAGVFAARDERDVQGFQLRPQMFGKYVRVEIHSHHGAEHFCPISLFRAYGTSEFEALETDGAGSADAADDDDDTQRRDAADADAAGRNLFGSARDAVISMVRKAAKALTTTRGVPGAGLGKQHRRRHDHLLAVNACSTLRNPLACDGCSDAVFAAAFQMLSCDGGAVRRLGRLRQVRSGVEEGACRPLGVRLGLEQRTGRAVAFFRAFLSQPQAAAVCNQATTPARALGSCQAPTLRDLVLELSAKARTTGLKKEAAKPPMAEEVKQDAAGQETEEAPPAEDASEEAPPDNGFDGAEQLVPEELQEVQNYSTPAPVQKESAFLRLSSRIKALERNMSLSGQYLEELSRRYKRQVEELQRAFNKTLTSLHEESRRSEQRERHLLERLDRLEATLEEVSVGWWGWLPQVLVAELTFAAFVLYLCSRLPEAPAPQGMDLGAAPAPSSARRRLSAPLMPPPQQPPPRERRPSDEALRILRSEPLPTNAKRAEKRRRRRRLMRSRSNVTVPQLVKVMEGRRASETELAVQRFEPMALFPTAAGQRAARLQQQQLECNGAPTAPAKAKERRQSGLKRLFRKIFE